MPTKNESSNKKTQQAKDLAKAIENSNKKDERMQPWKQTFRDEESINNKVANEADLAVYGPEIP